MYSWHCIVHCLNYDQSKIKPISAIRWKTCTFNNKIVTDDGYDNIEIKENDTSP